MTHISKLLEFYELYLEFMLDANPLIRETPFMIILEGGNAFIRDLKGVARSDIGSIMSAVLVESTDVSYTLKDIFGELPDRTVTHTYPIPLIAEFFWELLTGIKLYYDLHGTAPSEFWEVIKADLPKSLSTIPLDGLQGIMVGVKQITYFESGGKPTVFKVTSEEVKEFIWKWQAYKAHSEVWDKLNGV